MRPVLCLLAALAAFASGCGQTPPSQDDDKPAPRRVGKDGRPGPGKGDASSGKPAEKPDPLGPPEFKSASTAFVEEFDKDAKAAHGRYKGKVVELTGRLVTVGTNSSDEPVLTLEGPPASFERAQCVMADKYPWRSAAPGQTVTVKGSGHPSHAGPALIECVVVKAEGPKAPAFTAGALAAEYGKDREAARTKYLGKWLAVSGEVERVEFSVAKAADVVLKTDGKGPRLVAKFVGSPKATALKPGQRIEVLGEFSPLTVTENEVGLLTCVLLADPK